jgi:hypothetical protein
MIEIQQVPLWQLYANVALGAIVLWIKLNKSHKKVHGLSDVLDALLPNSPRLATLCQFLVFVVLGTLVGKLAVEPYTQMQAFAGGVAWSRLAAKD